MRMKKRGVQAPFKKQHRSGAQATTAHTAAGHLASANFAANGFNQAAQPSAGVGD